MRIRARRWTGLAVAGAIGGALATAGVPAGTSAATPSITPLSTGHSQWAWGNPRPQGQNLDAVAFQGATGYAVGTFGTILGSADAGQTWTGLASGTTDALSLVQELSPTTVVAAGGCSAVESTDSGASFAQLPLGLSEGGGRCSDPVAGIAFSDADHGYVELSDGMLLYTADAGATLQARTSAPVGSGRATGLAFESASTGLAVSSGGLIERTTDGGSSWTQVQSAPQGLNGVTVISPTLAYAVGNSGELLRSTDGGATWTALPLALQGGGTLPDLSSITCADAEDCLITSADSNALVRTNDGGQTAAIVTASNGALTGVAYSTGTTVVGVGQLGATSVSQDAGQTFSTISSDAMATAAPYGTLTAGLAAGTAYLTEPGGVAATTNAGRSWTLERVPGQGVMSVAFTSADGFALGEDGVLRRTTDGGVGWSALPGSHSSDSTLVAPSRHRLLLAGPRGIFLSADAGRAFHRVGGRLRGHARRGARVSSLRLNTAFAVHGVVVAYQGGSASSIVVSTDGGRRWRAVPPPPHPAHTAIDVSATSASRLWVYANSTLWATADGGRHWHALRALGRWITSNRPSEPYSGAVSFSSARHGIVMANGLFGGSVGEDPTLGQVSVLRTSNGGRSWTPEVIAGDEVDTIQSVLATARGDIAQLDTAAPISGDSHNRPIGFFTTAGVAAPARHTTLRVRFAHRTMRTRALARAGHRVLVTGRVRPVLSAAERVAVSYQIDGHAWQMRAVRLAGNGTFRLTLAHVRSSARVLAQAVGTSAVSGAGTPVARFSVRR